MTKTSGHAHTPCCRAGACSRRFCSQHGVTVGGIAYAPEKEKGGYGIRPYDIVKIYLFLRREPICKQMRPALRYEIVFFAKNAERTGGVFLWVDLTPRSARRGACRWFLRYAQAARSWRHSSWCIPHSLRSRRTCSFSCRG